MFITLDGIDGGGKSTQLAMLSQWLESQGFNVANFRDPGTTPLGNAVREILLHREDIPLANTTEMLLYMAARAQLVAENIRPAIEQGNIVLCDRFLLANVVYQGSAGGDDVEALWQVGRIATGGCMPDVTIVLDIDPAQASQRIQRGQDRLEKRGIEYFHRVRQGFLDQLPRCGGVTGIVDADRAVDVVHKDIVGIVAQAMQG
jgi:dTMP kinase